jgi:hypothetical protein
MPPAHHPDPTYRRPLGSRPAPGPLRSRPGPEIVLAVLTIVGIAAFTLLFQAGPGI